VHVYVCYARSGYSGQPQPPAFRPPFPVARPPMPYGPRPSSRYPLPPGPAPPPWGPPPPREPPPQRGPPPPSLPVIERQFVGMVGDHRGSPSLGRGGYDVVDDDSSMVDVSYPAKKTKAQMWRRVSSKKLDPAPDPYYDAPDMGPGYEMTSVYPSPHSKAVYRKP